MHPHASTHILYQKNYCGKVATASFLTSFNELAAVAARGSFILFKLRLHTAINLDDFVSR